MSIEWATVIASGTVSAVVGGLVGGAVSVATARRVAGRQEAGRSAIQARQRMRDLVGPQLTKVRQYQSYSMASVGRADDEKNHFYLSDFEFCAQLLIASMDLPRLPRWRVERRLRKLFGPKTVDLCDIHGQDAAKIAPGVVLQRQAIAVTRPELRLGLPDRGEFDRALRHAPDSPEISKLVQSLRQLAKSR